MTVLYEAYQSRIETKEKERLYYPRIVLTGKVYIEQIAQEIAATSSLSEGDVLNTIRNLIDVMQRNLQASHVVCLDGLGSFMLTMHAGGNGVKTDKEVSAAQARVGVRFIPSYKRHANKTMAAQSLVSGTTFRRFDKASGTVTGDEETIEPNPDGEGGGGGL